MLNSGGYAFLFLTGGIIYENILSLENISFVTEWIEILLISACCSIAAILTVITIFLTGRGKGQETVKDPVPLPKGKKGPFVPWPWLNPNGGAKNMPGKFDPRELPEVRLKLPPVELPIPNPNPNGPTLIPDFGDPGVKRRRI
jgi:hypothetical protein